MLVLDRIHRDNWRLLYPNGGLRSRLDRVRYEKSKIWTAMLMRGGKMLRNEPWTEDDDRSARAYLSPVGCFLLDVAGKVPVRLAARVRDVYTARHRARTQDRPGMNAFLSDTGSLLSRALWGGLRRAFGLRKGQIYRVLGKRKLTPEQERLLAIMRRDNAASHDPYRATEFWVRENRSFDDLFQIEGIQDVESQEINLRFSGHAPSRLLQYSAWMLYKDIKARDRLGLSRKIPARVSAESGREHEFEAGTALPGITSYRSTPCMRSPKRLRGCGPNRSSSSTLVPAGDGSGMS